MSYLSCLFFILFLLTLLIQLYFLKFRSVRKLTDLLHQQKQHSNFPDQDLPKISIIVCAKNEAENLREHLPYLLNQSYPSNLWEIIVVDDASSDNTPNILSAFQKQYAHFKVINIPKEAPRNFPGKKYALHQGIKTSCNELILLTDADCKPSSNQWLRTFAVTQLHTQKPILLGYGAYQKKKLFLNKLVQWETLQTCIHYAGMCLSGLPYMGVGRNLMYSKALYFQAMADEKFKELYASLPSGDDDLLISKIANKDNTSLCLEKEAYTCSCPPTTFRQWFRQKTRHVSTGKYYPKKVKRILGLWALSQGLFWLMWLFVCVAFIISFFTSTGILLSRVLAICFFLGMVRIILYWQNAQKWYAALNEKKLVRSYPIGEICLSAFQLALSPFIFWKNNQRWK